MTKSAMDDNLNISGLYHLYWPTICTSEIKRGQFSQWTIHEQYHLSKGLHQAVVDRLFGTGHKNKTVLFIYITNIVNFNELRIPLMYFILKNVIHTNFIDSEIIRWNQISAADTWTCKEVVLHWRTDNDSAI